ncbi:MAG: NAD-dependent epimerase/dehydratase family protein [Bacteroidota bacterium]
MESTTILITGANGQLGSALSASLANLFGSENILSTDIRPRKSGEGPFEILDVLDIERIEQLVQKHQVTEIYHLAAILSARGEQDPLGTWEINMRGLFNILETARKMSVRKVFFPSSIAVFGKTTPPNPTPQFTAAEPTTIYGISKLAGENWCQYYWDRYQLDVRSIRYPGIIGHNALPGGGTTDYAVDIYHKAVNEEVFECFLEANTKLPMIYMDDAIRATIELMQAPSKHLSVRTSYNLAGMSFSPQEVYESILKHQPDFQITYKPDYRQAIAASWPNRIDDSKAREDWNWQPEYDLPAMTREMLEQLKRKQAQHVK